MGFCFNKIGYLSAEICRKHYYGSDCETVGSVELSKTLSFQAPVYREESVGGFGEKQIPLFSTSRVRNNKSARWAGDLTPDTRHRTIGL
jgi:hypothetical protein